MNHWIVDQDLQPISSWLEAMPNARMLLRGQEKQSLGAQPGIVWWRLRAGEAVENIVTDAWRAQGRRLVVIADEPDVAVVASSLTLGASGCCNTYAAPEVLQQVALVVQNGGLWIGQGLLQQMVASTARIVGQPAQPIKQDDWSDCLSDREIQVARLIATGASNKEIAAGLSITERTVKAHLTAIFEKLGLRDRLQLSLRINGLGV